ncbi:MAG: hypothetical protein ACTHOH_16770 [Lysobacteraceae bacterium]
MNPYAPPTGRIEDAERGRRPKRGVAVWLPLVVCVLHSLFFLAFPLLLAVITYADTGSSFPLGEILRPTLLLLSSLTLVAAWALYRRKWIAILPLVCLPIAIAVHASRVHVDTPIPYFVGSLVLALYVLGLILARRLG